jgi:integrase
MKPELDKKLEVSDGGAWTPSTSLVRSEDYAALVNGITDRRDKAIILVLMDAGLRANELAQLDRDMIRCETHNLPDGSVETIGIGSVPSAKMRQNRQVFLSSEAIQAISEYLTADRIDDTDRPLFRGRHGGRLRARFFSKLLRESCDRVGIEPFGLNECRRRLVERLYEGGCDLFVIMSLLGYAEIEAVVRLLPLSNPKVD